MSRSKVDLQELAGIGRWAASGRKRRRLERLTKMQKILA
jgi:hypothetical protein